MMRKNRSLSTYIIIANFLVFIAWQSVPGEDLNNSEMGRLFLVSWQALVEGRFWVLITAVFSHENLVHFLANMFVLSSFGPIMEATMGRGRFLRFYLGAGIVSSLAHAMVSAFIMHKPEWPALGASGALSGLILLFSLIYPREKIALLGIIPMPAIVGALAFMALDIWGLFAQAEGGGLPIGHGAHLGGALAGILYYIFLWRPRRQTAGIRGEAI